MPRRMSRREERLYGAVAEDVIAIVVLAIQKQPPHVFVEVFTDVGRFLEPVRGKSVLELPALNDVVGVREVPDGSRVVEMQMRLYDVANRSRVDIHPLQLVDDEVVLAHHRFVCLDDVPPMAAGVPCYLEGVAAVVEYVAPWVGYEVERDRNLVGVAQPLVHLDELHLSLQAAALEEVES